MKKKKSYSKPKVIYEKKIVALAGVCDTTWVGPRGNCCMNGSCVKRST